MQRATEGEQVGSGVVVRLDVAEVEGNAVVLGGNRSVACRADVLGHVGYLVTPCSSLTSSIAGTELVSATANCGCEAVFGTINDQFSKHVAGYKGNNVVQRGKNVEQAARWSIPDLKDFFAEYAASVYQRRHHDGLVMPGFPT